MDEELKAMLEGAKAQGANDTDLGKIIDMYEADASKKKASSNWGSDSQPKDTATSLASGDWTKSKTKSEKVVKKVNPAFKSSIPSPIPDFNSMESGKKPAEKPAYSLKKPAILDKKEDSQFLDYLKENLDTGLATVSKSIYDAPGFIYDAAASVTNPVFEALGVKKENLASSDKLADDLGFKNIPSDILKEKIKISNEKINAYSAKNGGDALQAVQDGNYVGAVKLVAGTTMQSLPIMVAAMASGGQTSALTAIGLSTASTKNAQLKEEHPEMDLDTRVNNAATAGIIEAVTGHLFTGASGAVMKKILTEKGVEAGSKIIAKTFKSTVEKAIEKNPLVGAVGEIVEESAVEFGNQVNDMASGIRTEFDFHAIKNAGLSATGMGGLQTLGVYGAKGYVKAKNYAKLKDTNKKIFKLRSEIDNGNLSPENKAILGIRADRLEAENKKLLGTEIEKAKALPTEQKTELNALNNEFEDLKTKFDDIDDADDIPENLKPALKEEIKLQASKNQKRKTEILSQNDGLEVNDDFSKFEGVEPDFDLENGKISSLPLKEQNRLNKLAVEKITNGNKTVEYTKEQVSETANEIYANEQTPPTTEAQPQAEVPLQAVAENVDENVVGEENKIQSWVNKWEELKTSDDAKELDLFYNKVKVALNGYAQGKDVVKEFEGLKSDIEKYAQERKATPPVEDVVAPSVEGFQEIDLDNDAKEVIKNGSSINIKGEQYNYYQLKTYGAGNVFVIETPNGGEIGRATLNKDGYLENIRINEEFRRKGLGSKMYDYIEKTEGISIKPSPIKQSSEAKALWEKRNRTSEVKDKNELQIKEQEVVSKEIESIAKNTPNNKEDIEKSVYDVALKLSGYGEPITIEKIKQSIATIKDKNGNYFANHNEGKIIENLLKRAEVDQLVSKKVNAKGLAAILSEALSKTSADFENRMKVLKELENIYFKENGLTKESFDKLPNEEQLKIKKESSLWLKNNPELVKKVEESLKNEATPPTNTPADGNLPIGANNVGESGITEQESPAKESVPSSVDGGEVKGDASGINSFVDILQKSDTDAKSLIDKYGKLENIPANEKEAFQNENKKSNELRQEIDKISRKIQVDFDKKENVYIANGKKYETRYNRVLGTNQVNQIGIYDGDVRVGSVSRNWDNKKTVEFNLKVGEYNFENRLGSSVADMIRRVIKFENSLNTIEKSLEKPAETPQPKSVKGDIEVSDLDHAKDQIKKGVLLWNGDSGAERVNLGISWADIRKGESDINKGKTETVPAKRLIEALKTAKEKGGYEYVQGRGGVINKQFITLDAIQRSNNEYELTDLEQKEVDANEYESARKYDEEFNSISENEQVELLENYENSQDNSGTPSADSRQLQSESDVSKEKEGGKREKPTTKEKIAERIKLSDAKVDDWKNAVNGIDSIFGIKIKVDDIEGLNKNGIDIVDVIANIVKQAMAAGIHIDEAINKTIEHLKKTIDFDVNIDDIKERINPKKEESKSNDSRREKNSSEKASDLGINEKQYLDLGDKIKKIPQTGVFENYLSGKTIEREYANPTNDQSYDAVTLQDIAKHGEDVINQAKELFGDNYIEKTLDYLQSANLNSFEKGVVFAALENLMDTKVKSDPKNKQLLKLQELVYADSQANLRSASLGINTGRLRSVYNAIKNGIDVDKIASQAYTDKQKEAKLIIEGAVPNGENLNKASDVNKNSVVDADLEALISEGVDKQINEIYKKLPSNRRVKVDKAITALENIQKRLRTNTYDASIGLPIAIIDAGITVIKNSIKAGVNISDAIEIGINHIKAKYGKNWEKEDDFRKDMHDGFNTEGIDAKERSAKEKTKIKGIKETVKQALIDAGFYREIKTKNGVNKVLDWVKLVGRDASVEGLKKNVEEQLKKQGFDDAKIAEISNELEIEYKRLAKDILDKATADLERRNLIKPSPNRKSDNQILVDLFNEGLFGDNIKKYENAVNRILGFSDIDNANYDKIKQKLFALSELYKTKIKGDKLAEQSINAVSNELNHAISNIMAVSSYQQGNVGFKIASLAHEYAVLAQKALLGGIKTLAENVISGDYAATGNRAITDKYMTPELKKQSKANVKAVKNDIVENAGLYYGDVTTSLVTHSIIEDLINQKITSKTGHIIMSAVTLRRWLDAKDSAIKVRLTDALFVKNAVDILTSKTNPNGAMTQESAIQFVSEALTGENFDKALITAKNVIDDVNSKQEVKQLKDNPEAIHRFAMELVRENLMRGKRMSMSEIEASFKGAYKSAGRSIGHEANNPISRQVNMGNAYISGELNKAISNKDYPKATVLMVQSLIMRAIVQPFAGGGANWTVIGAEKGVPVIGWISTANNYVYREPLELNSVTGVKNLQESLFRENNFKESAVRNIIGTGMAVVAYAVMMGYKDDDDETNAKKFNDWLNKPENKWVRPYFNKLSPTAFSFIVAMEDENLGRYLAQLFGNSGDSFNNTLKVIKATDSKKEGAMAGATGKLVGQPFSSPFAWKPIKDAVEIYKGLNGIVPKKKSYKVNGFMNGYLQGGLLEQLGLRPDLKNDFDSPEAKFKEKQDKRKEKGDVPEEEKAKIKANNSAVRIRSIVTELENELKSAESNTPYYNSKGKLLVFTPQKIKNIKNSIRREKLSLEKKIKKAGDLYKEPEE